MAKIFEELNSLVGLTKVKQVLQDLVSLMELKEKTKDSLKIKNTNLHMVFLGNPGTGKTTIVNAIIQVYKEMIHDSQIQICAPTGRASKRLTEITGIKASTIHRLLKWDFFH